MTENRDAIVFDDNSCPSLDHMIQYKEGKLNEPTARSLEKHVLHCSMCNEVFDHVGPEDIADMTALTASIDKRVDKRIAGGGTGSTFNFNRYMAIAASLVGILIVVSNLFTNTHMSKISDEVPVLVEQDDGGLETEGKRESEELVATKSEIAEIDETIVTKPDSLELDREERLALLEVVAAETFLEMEEAVVASSEELIEEEITETVASTSQEITDTRFLLASVELLTVKVISQPGDKGSTDKKVSKGKIKSNQGYVPAFEEDEGYPQYAGGQKKLSADIVKRINELNLSLAEGGEVDIWITVSANGTVGPIKVDEKVSVAVASQLKSAVAKLPPWIPGNVKVQYTVKVRLR